MIEVGIKSQNSSLIHIFLSIIRKYNKWIHIVNTSINTYIFKHNQSIENMKKNIN